MTEYFAEGGLRITDSQLEYGSSTYPLHMIEDSTPVRMGLDVITFLINAGIGVAGVVIAIGSLVSGVLPGVIVGGLMAAWGWFVGKGVLKVEHLLSIDFHDGRSLKIKSTDFEFIQRAHDALTRARRS